MAANQSAAPIIIKKVKKGGHGHHGGAWKVAFADFVTAMMAFFLLMWLLGSTTSAQKASISSYFNDPMATAGYSGNGAGNPALDGGDGILAGRGENPFTAQSSNKENNTSTGPAEDANDDARERARMIKMMDELKAVIDAAKQLKDFADQILFDITPEGLRIQIIDKENRAMFDPGSATLKAYTREILHGMVKVISEAPNRISVSGHTDASQYAAGSDYGNWELSADRANAARRELLSGGLPEEKIERVVGLGASDLLDPSQPDAPLNRRISIVVLRGDHGKTAPVDAAAAGAPAASADALTAPATDASVSPPSEDAATSVLAPTTTAPATPPTASGPAPAATP